MYRLNDIVESFLPLVGWRQDRSPAYRIDEAITHSDSGLYFQEAHPLLTLRAMQSIMPQDWNEGYDTYSNATEYSKGDKVRNSLNDKIYKSLVNNNIGNALTDATKWEEYNTLTDYLADMEERGVKKVVTRFINEKVIGLETKNIIDRRCLFDGTGRIDNRVENHNRLVGFEITPLRSDGLTTKIEKLGLQFIGNTGEIKIYLFHSSLREPVATKTVTYNKSNGTFLWFDLEDWYLPYVGDNNAGGSWYIMYNQRTLPAYMEAINFGRDWSREPCGTCNKGDLQLYRLMTRWAEFSPFYVNIPEDWDETLWDIQNNIYTNGNNYGINMMFSMGCDLTNTLIAERMDFAQTIQLQVAEEALRTLALNPEVNVNRVQYNADRDNVLYETDGNGQGIKGLKGELDKAFKALSFDTRGLSDVCLTCKSKGIKFGAI